MSATNYLQHIVVTNIFYSFSTLLKIYTFVSSRVALWVILHQVITRKKVRKNHIWFSLFLTAHNELVTGVLL